MSCKACGLRTLIRDDATENMICDSCGTVQDFINYQERAFNINGPTGVFISIGSSGCGSVLNYKEKKIYEANNLIDDVVFKLGLTGGSKVREIRDMISKVTDGRFGSSESRWFSIFVGACVYVVMRNDVFGEYDRNPDYIPDELLPDVVACETSQSSGRNSRMDIVRESIANSLMGE